MSDQKINSREEWLTRFMHEHLNELMKKAGTEIPAETKVSVGFPGGGSARKRLGECWTKQQSSINVNEIFISPKLTTIEALCDVLAHEAIHASDDCKSGHRGHFKKIAKHIGLKGPMKSTTASEEFAAWRNTAIAAMPPFNYGSLDLGSRKKAPTNMLKLECSACGAIWRMSAKWYDTANNCPCCLEEIQK